MFIDADQRIRFWSRAAEVLFRTDAAQFPRNATVLQAISVSPELETSAAAEIPSRGMTSPPEPTSNDCGPNALDSDHWESYSERISIGFSESDPVLVDREKTAIEIGGKTWMMIRYRKAWELDPHREELKRQAETDPLSELLNRRGFQRVLESSLDRALTLVIIDVDFFKRINDAHGHPTGDEAIQWIARQIRSAFEDSICSARLGGDEFGIVLNSQDITATRIRFESFCEQVKSNSAQSPFEMSISVGVAVSTAALESPRELLAQADRAMYQSKQNGRNRVTVVEV